MTRMISAWWLVPAALGGMVLALPVAVMLCYIATAIGVAKGLNW
jgi:hypothetical protein